MLHNTVLARFWRRAPTLEDSATVVRAGGLCEGVSCRVPSAGRELKHRTAAGRLSAMVEWCLCYVSHAMLTLCVEVRTRARKYRNPAQHMNID
jgi:hypothetical protein